MEIIDKRDLVACGLVKAYDKARLKSFRDFDRSALDDLEECIGEINVARCKAVSHGRYKRIDKCRQKVSGCVLKGEAVFFTLTFRDELMEKSTVKTRRLRVTRILKKTSSVYVANIDFGDKEKNPESKGREHYHGIAVLTNEKKLRDYWEKNCGFLKIQKAGSSDSDNKKMAKYINKLTAHAFKDSTRQYRVIYSRKRI